MDILLTAILGALTKLTEQGVMDAYQGLKDLLKRKLGGDSDLVAAVEAVERKPDSPGRQRVLEEEVAASAVATDPQIRDAVQALIALLQALPQGRDSSLHHIQVTQTLRGDGNIVSGTGHIHVEGDQGIRKGR